MSIKSALARAMPAASGQTQHHLRTVFITTPSEKVAKEIGHDLVDRGLVACVNVIPGITSIYKWQGKVEEDSEVLLMGKTRASLCGSIVERVGELHPYDVPEVIFNDVVDGSKGYLDWVEEATK